MSTSIPSPIHARSSAGELEELRARARADYEALRARHLRIDLTRGKPGPEQLDLSSALLTLPGNGDYTLENGGDSRNYGGVQGLPEARELFAPMLGASPDCVVVANNSSLAVMHDCIVYALLKGMPDSPRPWSAEDPVRFLCPSPGYDRHFAICESYGIDMIPVALTGQGPDMDRVESLVRDPAVRGMWCVPKYSNPTGEIYSDETIERLARMETAAPDFRLFWDNAYSVHHLTDREIEIANILERCAAAGHAERPLVFGSTSKITFAGGGVGLLAASSRNIAWYLEHGGVRSIGPDKLNQLRHVRFLRSHDGILELMRKHRALVVPKFAAVDAALERRLAGSGFARWTKPLGGYFVSVDVIPGCAARVVELAKGLGVVMVPAGQTYPYRTDPNDSNLRIAPTYASLTDIEAGAEAIAVCIELAVCERLLADGGEA